MPVSWIEHKGRKILFGDYSNLLAKDALALLLESEKELRKLITPTPILMDYSGCYANQEFVDQLKRVGKQYDKVFLKCASVGVTGIKKILATAVNTFIGAGAKNKYFDTLADAKEWLVE